MIRLLLVLVFAVAVFAAIASTAGIWNGGLFVVLVAFWGWLVVAAWDWARR